MGISTRMVNNLVFIKIFKKTSISKNIKKYLKYLKLKTIYYNFNPNPIYYIYKIIILIESFDDFRRNENLNNINENEQNYSDQIQIWAD